MLATYDAVVKWFAAADWTAGCESEFYQRVPTPVGEMCLWCDEAIEDGQTGYVMPYIGAESATEKPEHVECFIRSIIGSLGHQMRQCSCYGGDRGDPPIMTKREAAVAAYRHFIKSQQVRTSETP